MSETIGDTSAAAEVAPAEEPLRKMLVGTFHKTGTVLMFKILVLQALYSLSDEATEFQIKDRLSFQRFLGLGLDGTVPDATTVWLFRERLVQAKAMFGSEALYSLQIAVYGRRDLPNPSEADLAETRKAAEQAAIRLRQEGEQAFYYHGPRMSMVTIGVFGIDDFDPQTPSYKSSRLLAAQKRHPYNLYNGAGIKEKRNPRSEGKLQPSNLVALPEK